ncbi:hypothetical protein V6N13_043984 [Hibiscus sabdariffa]
MSRSLYLLSLTNVEGLQHVNIEMEAKVLAPFQSDRSQPPQSANKVSYSQVGFSYDGVKDEADFSDAAEEEEEEDDEFNSDDSQDLDCIQDSPSHSRRHVRGGYSDDSHRIWRFEPIFPRVIGIIQERRGSRKEASLQKASSDHSYTRGTSC